MDGCHEPRLPQPLHCCHCHHHHSPHHTLWSVTDKLARHHHTQLSVVDVGHVSLLFLGTMQYLSYVIVIFILFCHFAGCSTLLSKAVFKCLSKNSKCYIFFIRKSCYTYSQHISVMTNNDARRPNFSCIVNFQTVHIFHIVLPVLLQ